MKLLADENIGLEVVRFLRRNGNDVISVIEEFPSAKDLRVLSQALSEERILITSDKDFGELIYKHGLSHRGVILLRLKDETNENKIEVLSGLFKTYKGRLRNQFVVVSETKVRFRKRKPGF